MAWTDKDADRQTKRDIKNMERYNRKHRNDPKRADNVAGNDAAIAKARTWLRRGSRIRSTLGSNVSTGSWCW
jgi:hypothetical protein